MTLEELKSLTIRSGVLVQRDYGCLLGCDPSIEADSPHAKLVVISGREISDTWMKFNAHSLCAVIEPEQGIVAVSPDGFFAVFAQRVVTGNIFDAAAGTVPRYGSIRSVSSVGGRAYAVGLRGAAFRLDQLERWTPIDRGLLQEANLEALDGFGGSDIYAVGRKGVTCRFDGQNWVTVDSVTNINLNAVLCAGDGFVYAGGYGGTVVKGRGANWEILEQPDVKEPLWALAWFGGELFASSLSGVYRLSGNTLNPVDFGAESPATTYRLTTADGLLWSIGENDVVAFDGKDWRRVV